MCRSRPGGVVFVRKAVILLAILSLILPVYTFAFENEPEDFNGIGWGTRVHELSGMVLLSDEGNVKFYERKDDKVTMAGVAINPVVYGFYKDRFYRVDAYYNLLHNFLNIKEELSRKHGQAVHSDPQVNRYFWYGERVSILLNFYSASNSGRISISYDPIGNEINEEPPLDSTQ